jgi:hypothetical protein
VGGLWGTYASAETTVLQKMSLKLQGTRFTNAVSCFELGPQEPYSVLGKILLPCIVPLYNVICLVIRE